MNDAHKTGLDLFREIYGPQMADGIAANIDNEASFGREQSRWTLEWAFGSVWARDGLERKMRSCAVIGMLIGGGHSEELEYHTRMGIANGLTRKELEEIFYTAIPYCGFPAANRAKEAMLKMLDQIEGDNKTTG